MYADYKQTEHAMVIQFVTAVNKEYMTARHVHRRDKRMNET